tara:strand:- start:915 stop:1241 length:327 start_codon:yes stop_codon:yes gene_type:complete
MSKQHRILPIYPSKPTGDDLEAFRSAKGELSLDYLIQPVRAFSGSPFRIIAIKEHPDWICDYAFVPEVSVASIKAAMKWALSDDDDPRAITVLKSLKKVFGEGVKEIV